MSTIQIRRGNYANLAALSMSAGEPAFILDTKELYIYDGTNKILSGRVIVDTASNRPAAGIQGRKFLATDTEVLSVDTGSAWVDISGGGGAQDIEVTQWKLDDTVPAENVELWGIDSAVRFANDADDIAYCSFEVPETWDPTKDIVFNLGYSLSANPTSGDKVSLNVSYIVAANGETPNIASPDATVEDELDVGSLTGSVYYYQTLTNIKIAAADIPAAKCRVIMKVWRDVDGVTQNFGAGFDLVSLRAKQSA